MEVNTRFGSSSSIATFEPAIECARSENARPKIDAPHSNRLLSQGHQRRPLRFTTDEDDFLKRGIDKHGFGQWTVILRDPDFRFQKGRLADSLKKRGLNGGLRPTSSSTSMNGSNDFSPSPSKRKINLKEIIMLVFALILFYNPFKSLVSRIQASSVGKQHCCNARIVYDLLVWSHSFLTLIVVQDCVFGKLLHPHQFISK